MVSKQQHLDFPSVAESVPYEVAPLSGSGQGKSLRALRLGVVLSAVRLFIKQELAVWGL